MAQRLDELKRQSEMRLANVANMESLFNNSFENEIRITLGNLSDANTTLSQTRNASSVALMQATAMNVTGRTVEMVRLDSLTQQQSYTNLKSQQTSLNMVLANLQQNISEAKVSHI